MQRQIIRRPSIKLASSWRLWPVSPLTPSFTMLCRSSPSWVPTFSTEMIPTASVLYRRWETLSFTLWPVSLTRSHLVQTIDSIVPVMVASLKEHHGSGMTLYHASREFLRVFTNAANHVPRHRRVNFFSHLVDTLGPADFLAPTAMLLVDRVSNRVVRQSATESGGSLFLPLTIHERYSADLQLSVCRLLFRFRRRAPAELPF